MIGKTEAGEDLDCRPPGGPSHEQVLAALDSQRETIADKLEERDQLKAMFSSAVVGIAEIDPRGRFLLVNEGFCDLVARSREQLTGGMDCYEITHPEDRAETAAWIASLARGVEHFTLEKRYLRPDGTIVWVTKNVSAIRDAAGLFKGAVAVVADTTERKAAEDELRESEQRYRELAEALGVAAYMTDADGHITLYNEAAVELWGRRPEVGVDRWCGSFRIYLPDGSPLALDHCPMAVSLREDRPVRNVEILVERPDGGRSYVLPYPTPLHDRAGRMIGGINVLLDITGRKQVELDLAARNQLIQSMTDNLSVGMVLLDAQGRIEFLNPAAERITGYRFSGVQGRRAHDVIHRMHPDGSPYAVEDCPMDQANRTGQPLMGHEDVFVRPDGSFYDVSINVAPLRRGGFHTGVIVDIRDITLEKRAEASLQHSLEIKDQFLSLVSHELRTPIATVLGNGLVLLRRYERLSDEARHQALEDIVSEGEKLQHIVENLLLLTRLEAGQRLELQPIDLRDVIEESVVGLHRRRPRREVRVDIAPAATLVRGEPTLLALVLQNLISNADKYSPVEATIEVVAHRADMGAVEVLVRDHGIGMDEADIEQVFTPFYRTMRARHHARGIGLGLAVCRRILEAHGGSIRAIPRPGEGTDFFFNIPSAEESLPPVEA